MSQDIPEKDYSVNLTTMEKRTIAVLGSGSWGTALVKILSMHRELTVHWWVRHDDDANHIYSNVFFAAGGDGLIHDRQHGCFDRPAAVVK
jgi:hypothetical protein